MPPPEPSTLLLIPREIPSTLEGPPRTAASYPIKRDPLLEHGKVLTRDLAGREALSSGKTEKWMKYSMHTFPTSSDEARVEEMEAEGWNVSSLQLSVFIGNMGNLARPSVISGKKIDRKVSDMIPLVTRFVLQNWSHIRLFCESQTLQDPAFQEFLRGKNLVGAHGSRHEGLSCYAAGNAKGGTKVECIVEGGDKQHMAYCIFESPSEPNISPQARSLLRCRTPRAA